MTFIMNFILKIADLEFCAARNINVSQNFYGPEHHLAFEWHQSQSPCGLDSDLCSQNNHFGLWSFRDISVSQTHLVVFMLCFTFYYRGNFGLWLDEDLYHGRSNRCETYDNDVLTDAEDFVVKAFEAWIFQD